MHPDRLFPSQDLDFMRHHTGFVQCRLSVKNDYIAIPDMPVDFLILRLASEGG